MISTILFLIVVVIVVFIITIVSIKRRRAQNKIISYYKRHQGSETDLVGAQEKQEESAIQETKSQVHLKENSGMSTQFQQDVSEQQTELVYKRKYEKLTEQTEHEIMKLKNQHKEEISQISAQLRHEVLRSQMDMRQLQQDLAHYKRQCEEFKQECQFKQQQIELENLIRESDVIQLKDQATRKINQLTSHMHELWDERDSLNIQLCETRESMQREREAAREEKCQLNAVLRQKENQLLQLQKVKIDTWDFSHTQSLSEGGTQNFPQKEVEMSEEIGLRAIRLVMQGHNQNQQVTVKKIHWKKIVRGNTVIDEFKREIGIMASIKHHNNNLLCFIAAVFDEKVEIPLKLLHINLRRAYCEGIVEMQYHNVMISIFCDVANGLNYLHDHQEPIMHHNMILSASNILLDPQTGFMWRAKLSDFSPANFLKCAKTLGVGAIVYTAPEMFPQEGPSAPMPRPTTKCDVFSYGIVLMEVITKTMPTTENCHQLFDDVKAKWPLMYDLVSQCTEILPDARLTISDILKLLQSIPIEHSHTQRLQSFKQVSVIIHA